MGIRVRRAGDDELRPAFAIAANDASRPFARGFYAYERSKVDYSVGEIADQARSNSADQ